MTTSDLFCVAPSRQFEADTVNQQHVVLFEMKVRELQSDFHAVAVTDTRFALHVAERVRDICLDTERWAKRIFEFDARRVLARANSIPQSPVEIIKSNLCIRRRRFNDQRM